MPYNESENDDTNCRLHEFDGEEQAWQVGK